MAADAAVTANKMGILVWSLGYSSHSLRLPTRHRRLVRGAEKQELGPVSVEGKGRRVLVGSGGQLWDSIGHCGERFLNQRTNLNSHSSLFA